MRRFLSVIAIAITSMTISATRLSAQATASAVLQGTVTDSSSAVIPNAGLCGVGPGTPTDVLSIGFAQVDPPQVATHEMHPVEEHAILFLR